MQELHDPVDLAPYLAAEKGTVVFFEMSNCPYCLAYKARFAELAAQRPDLGFLRVQLDDPGNPLWERYAIRAVPTVIAFAGGAVSARADSMLALGLTKKRWLDFVGQI